ncbi:hypothetical protein [Paracidovorax valerianellae]|uniref:hypothetical protein n=1 Tax=Paracidovorax valerianellae TaxID=187868 RepID=UPI002304257B|nr:hypothetical protein [Paracidovorax valerianellae]MDA8445294.1 hypothetical protein [Paracidovorax valerianellae]
MNSALIHMPKSYHVTCPAGMLPDGEVVKRFTSLQAFEGYVTKARELGCTVQWHTPFTVTVEASK